MRLWALYPAVTRSSDVGPEHSNELIPQRHSWNEQEAASDNDESTQSGSDAEEDHDHADWDDADEYDDDLDAYGAMEVMLDVLGPEAFSLWMSGDILDD